MNRKHIDFLNCNALKTDSVNRIIVELRSIWFDMPVPQARRIAREWRATR